MPTCIPWLASTTADPGDFVVPQEDYRKTGNWLAHGIETDAMKAWLDKFVHLNTHLVSIYSLAAGKLYYFDTRNYHNVWSFGAESRFTLAIDLVANEWLYARFPEAFERS